MLPMLLIALIAMRAEDSTRARAERPLAELFTADDYPTEALRLEMEGQVHFRLNVDPQGRVQDCKIVESSSHELLDRTTCEILRSRARFTPARDASGKAVADTVFQRVTWRIQPQDAFPFQPTLISTSVSMTSSGLRCDQSGGDDIAPTLTGEDCVLATRGFARVVEAGGPGTVATMQIHFVPEGGRLETGEAVEGIQLLDGEADFEIGQDGRVVGCESRRFELLTPLPPSLAGQNFCAPEFLQGLRFEPSTERGTRRGRLRILVHISRLVEV